LGKHTKRSDTTPLVAVTVGMSYGAAERVKTQGATIVHADDVPFSFLDGLIVPGGTDINPALYGQGREQGGAAGVDFERDELEITAIRYCLEHDIPVLGICRGHQALNVAAGGTLWQDIDAAMEEFPEEFNLHSERKVKPKTRMVRYRRSGLDDEDSWREAQSADDYYSTFESCGLGSWGAHLSIDHMAYREQSERFHLSRLIPAVGLQVNSIHHQAVNELAPGFKVLARAQDGVVEAIETLEHPFAVGVQFHPEMSSTGEFYHVSRALFQAFTEAARRHARGVAGRRNFSTLRAYKPYQPRTEVLTPSGYWQGKQFPDPNTPIRLPAPKVETTLTPNYFSAKAWLHTHDVPMHMTSFAHAADYQDWVQRLVRNELVDDWTAI
jgi:putative glutamine amidotransferase